MRGIIGAIAWVVISGGAVAQGVVVSAGAVAQGVVGDRGAVTAMLPAAVPPAADPVPALDACVSRLDPEVDVGFDRIAVRCPDLVKQLEHGAWAPWLPRGWKEPGNDLSAGSLKEFRELVGRESAAGTSLQAPDVRHLKRVLSGLADTSTVGWWSRFKSWLRSILETREQSPDESWFSRMVSHVGIPQSLRQLIAYVALIAVVLLAAVIVFNEVRAAGLLPKRGDRARTRRGAPDMRAPGMAWSDIERAVLTDKPRLLLELIVRRLSDRGSLPPAGALTVRELTRAARLPEPDDRTRLSELALAAERVRYSSRDLESAALNESLARGRELLDRLDASTPG